MEWNGQKFACGVIFFFDFFFLKFRLLHYTLLLFILNVDEDMFFGSFFVHLLFCFSK